MATIGRPPAENPRTKNHMVRLDAAEDELVRAAAAAVEQAPSTWIREQAVKAARRAAKKS